MAAIARRWIRAFCEGCGDTVEFEVRDGHRHPDWVLVCTECSLERRLEDNGLLAPAPVRRLVA